MSGSMDVPHDAVLERVMACLEPTSMLHLCRQNLPVMAQDARAEKRHGRIIEALYHPQRYLRVAYAFVDDPSLGAERVWPEGDVVYFHAPARPRMSQRGVRITLNGCAVELYRFPKDRRLSGPRRLARRDSAIGLWQRWLDGQGMAQRLDPLSLQRRLLRYVPEQKWIARLRATSAQPGGRTARKHRIAVRCSSPIRCGALLDRQLSLRRLSEQPGARFHTARVIGHERRLGILAVKWAQGKNLLELLREDSSWDVLQDLAARLATLHASVVTPVPTMSAAAVRQQIQNALDDLSSACPELRGRLERMRGAMDKALGRLDTVSPVTLHNDLHWGQLRIDGQRWTLLDFERMSLGDPLIDVANMSTQLRMLGFRTESGVDPAAADRWADEFLESWGRVSNQPISPDPFRCYTILALLNLARGRMRHLREGWRALTHTCVELAEVELDASDHRMNPARGTSQASGEREI